MSFLTNIGGVEPISGLGMVILGIKIKASNFDQKKTNFAVISPYHAYCSFSQLVWSRHATHFVQMGHTYGSGSIRVDVVPTSQTKVEH